MSLDLNDPRLTAYALNELEPTAREEIERLLADDPTAQNLVKELSQTADFLTCELAAEPSPELSDAQKQAVRNGHIKPEPALQKKNIIVFPRRRWVVWTSGLAAAAAIAWAALWPAISVKSLLRADRQSVAQGSTETMKPVAVAVVTTAPAPMEPAIPPAEEKKKTELPPLAQLISEMNPSTMMADSASPSSPPVPVASPAATVNNQSVSVGTMALRKEGTAQDAAGLTASGYTSTPIKSVMMRLPSPYQRGADNTESYAPIAENGFLSVRDNPLSTFSIDVDTASYANVRRFLQSGQPLPADAVRIEEMLNYFPYNYAPPAGDDPFSSNVEVADCPWNREHRLVRIGLKGHEVSARERPASNLVFLVDVSGSMNEPDKLPWVKRCLQMLVNQLNARDRIALVVYAGNSGLALPSTPVNVENKSQIFQALEALQAGGSTNGGEGIQVAYRIAEENFIKGGTNRVILCTDGDFNVGVTSQDELISLIGRKARSGVFLSVLGFGTGNLKDSTMMNLADKGNGNYAYIDSLEEGRKVLVEQMSGTLVTIAKDVKIQVEFNPAKVSAYRLIGYEKRLLAKEDFNNDKKDAGEIGAGHTVTALYEIVPPGKAVGTGPSVDPLKYQPAAEVENRQETRSSSDEMLTLKIRYKQPGGTVSQKLEFPILDNSRKWEDASVDFKFAASVATFGMVLRHSPERGDATYALAMKLAQFGKGEDVEGYRGEFIRLVKIASLLTPQSPERD